MLVIWLVETVNRTDMLYPHVCLLFQVVEDGYEFFAKRQLVTLFSAPNYCGEFDNAGAMMSVDETLMCSFQVGKTCSENVWLCVAGSFSFYLCMLPFGFYLSVFLCVCLSVYRLVGLMVSVQLESDRSGFNFCFWHGSFLAESNQVRKNWYSIGFPVRCLGF